MKYIAIVDEQSLPVFVDRQGDSFIVEINGKRHVLDFISFPGSSLHSMIVDGRQYEMAIEKTENGLLVYIDGETHRVRVSEDLKLAKKKERKAKIEIKAAMPGLVVAVEVKPGQTVSKDDGLLILEAMKMQNEVRAPQAGTVTEVHVRGGLAVEKGERLVTIQA